MNTNLPDRNHRQQKPTPKSNVGKPPLLRRQAGLAALLLLCPWLATVFLCWPLFRDHPFLLVGLLPGLLVAVHLQRLLLTRLDSNHRSGEADHPFPTLGAATWITLLRAAGIVALAGFLPLAARQGGGALEPALLWAPGLLYLGICLADLLDGMVARRQHRETELGKRLDIETDAAGLLVATLVAVSLSRLPLPSLLVGMAYYPFILGIWWRQQNHLPLIPLQSRPYGRIIAGIQMGLVGMALLPLLQPRFTFIAAYLVMMPLLAGFVRDWLVVSCRLQTGNNQETGLDRWAGLALTRYLPLGLRLIILAGGVATLAGGAVFPTHPLWQWALGCCCLLAGLGCLGRSGALLLALLLGSILSPFATTAATLVLFGAATILMLTGTGPLSLWSPEERFLYRRNRENSGVEQ